jgi:D-glycero-alpha-D-manno-heptose 1-phosphate guanylyltransferase
MEAIILAGGLGTRLRSRLADRPKPMALINGRPFLQILLDRLVEAQFDHILISVGHLREVIIKAFADQYRGVRLHYVVEESPLGTGGAIRNSLEFATESSLLVLNGDTYIDVDYRLLFSTHSSTARPMTMTLVHAADMGRYGGVRVSQGEVAGFIEKGRTGAGWINAGVYVLDRAFPWPELLPSRFSFELDVLAPNISKIRPAAFVCNGRFLDIGLPDDLDKAQTTLGGLEALE